MPELFEKITQSDFKIYNTLPQAIIIYDFKKIYFINNIAIQLFNLPKIHQFIYDKNILFDYLKKPYHAPVKERLEKILAGETFGSSELEFNDFKNKSVFVEAVSKLISLEGKKVVLSSMTQTNEQVKQNKILNNALNLLNNLSKNSNEIIFELAFFPEPNIKYISDSVTRILGKTPQQLYNNLSGFKKQIHKEDLTQYINLLKEHTQIFKKTKSHTSVFRFYNSENKIIYIENTCFPVYDIQNKITGLVGTLKDITAAKLVEIELNEIKQKFDLITNNGTDVFAFYTFLPKPHYLYVSPNVEKLLGYTQSEIMRDSNFFNNRLKSEIEKNIEVDKGLLKNQKNILLIFKINNSKGELIWIQSDFFPITSEQNKIIFYLLRFKDITIRKEKEIEIEKQNKNYQNLIDGSPMSYVIHKDGKFLYVNNSFLKLLKIKSKDKIIQKSVIDLFFADDKARALNRIKEISNNIKLNQYFNYKLIDNQKNIINVEIKSLNIKFNNTDCILSLVNNLDEVEQREHQIEIIKNKETDNKLLQSEVKERKQAEKLLLEKTNHLTSIFESSTHLIWTVNKHFELTSFNKNFSDIVFNHYNVKIKEGDAIDKLLIENKKTYITFWHSKYNEAFKGNKLEFEKEDVGITNIVRQVYINPILNQKNQVTELSCIAHDITKTKLYEQKLLNQTAKLTAVIESGTHLAWTVNKKLELTSYNQNFFGFIQEPTKHLKNVILRIENFVQDPVLIKFWTEKYNQVLSGNRLTFTHKSRIKGQDLYREIFLNPIYSGDDIVEVSAIAQDITARVMNEQRLLNQTAKLTAIFDSSNHYIWTMDKEQRLTSFNKNYFDLLSSLYNIQPYIGLTIKNRGILSNDKTYAEVLEFHYDKAFKGVSTNFEIETLNKEYVKIYLEIFLNPIFDNYVVVEVNGIAHNITESKHNQLRMEVSLKEKEVLLKEVHHRVKNNMQVVSSILNLQSSYVSDEYALSLLKESQNRIKTMAYIHESLYQNKSFTSVNFSDYLYTLLNNIVQSYSSSEKIKLNLNIEKITLSLDNSIPVGLIINELVTNAIKHAFQNQKQGTITLNLKSANNVVFLELKDNGCGFNPSVSFENSNSLGLQLVNTLIEQIDATVEFSTKANGGSKFLISFNI